MYSDQGLGDSYVGRKLMTGGLIVVVVLLAISLLKAAAYGDILTLVVTACFALVVAWTFTARDNWWLVLPAAVSFGGFFYFGFRIMLYEIGLVLCLLPLFLSVLSAPQRMRVQGRATSALPFALLTYLVVHGAVSILRARAVEQEAIGSVARVYTSALWPLIFLMLFHMFGRTNRLGRALLLMYLAALVRVGLGALALIFPDLMYIPGINFVLPGAATGGTDLRFSTLLFVSFSLCYIRLSRRSLLRAYHVIMIAVSGVMVLFGAGRVGFLMYLFAILFFLVIHRCYTILVTLALVLSLLCGTLNAAPDTLYRFPKPIRRTLSSLVFQSKYSSVHEEVEASNEWHFQLARRGRYEWLKSPRTFFFGNRIRPFSEDYTARSANVFTQLEIAVGMGAYESGLWTVVACTGVVGAFLYGSLMLFLWRSPLRRLRRSGIHNASEAFYFLALCRGGTWLLFCWIAGHFPADELMFATIAKAASDDEAAAKRNAPLEPASSDDAPAAQDGMP